VNNELVESLWQIYWPQTLDKLSPMLLHPDSPRLIILLQKLTSLLESGMMRKLVIMKTVVLF
jgi:hypothetical protein